MTAPLGVILAGGRATRMGGGDKGLRMVGERRLIDYVIDRLALQCGQLAINANGDPSRLAEFGLPILPDSLPDHPGPLAGVLAGLDWAAGQGAEAIVTAAADTPFFPDDLVARLVASAGPAGLCLAASPDETGRVQRQPTFGLWPVALRDDLRAALTGGLRKIVIWTDSHAAGEAVFDARPFDPFFNVNTPEDIAIAEALIGGHRAMRVYGVTGWKNTGKTTLTERLVAELVGQGLRVSTLKHAHHATEIDHPGRDSHRHREAGAGQVIVASPVRWALMTELRGAEEPPLADLLARFDPCDLILIEGYKTAPHPKIETHRQAAGRDLLAPGNATIRAIASDRPLDTPLPRFDLDDVASIAAFIRAEVGL